MRVIEDLSELGSSPEAIAERWLDELEQGNKFWDKWRRRAKKIVKIYADESDGDAEGGAKKINILWSNVETIKPALYAKTPTPEVSRRNKDKDPIGREASEVLERCLEYCNDAYDFDGVMRDTVHDFALSSLGVARVIYDPLIEGDPEQLIAEYAKIDYVHRDDFTTNEARKWSEVRWIAFRHFLTRSELKALSPQHAAVVTLDHSPEDTKEDSQTSDLFKKATVYEIWDKQSGLVYYIAKSFKDAPLKVQEPFCKFNEFFPCPRPLTGTQGSKIVPTPDYVLYQDQAEIINELTNKIYTLTKALKLAGVYNGKIGQLENLLGEGHDNTLIPVENWASFAQGGGIQGAIQLLPVKEVAETLLTAWESREKAKQDLYEATGLSDIVRGASDPNETATAQSIKNQWGSLRIRDRQKEVQRFARDLIRLKAEVIAEKFDIKTLMDMSGVKLLTNEQKMMLSADPATAQNPDAAEMLSRPTWEEVKQLLADDRMRGFSIDIETDSTIEPDEQADKASRIEFITAISGFLQQVGVIVQAAPETAKMMGELLTFGVRGFKVGSQLEGTIETTMENLQARTQQPQPPNPEMLKVEHEKAKAQSQMQIDQQKVQLEQQKASTSAALEDKKIQTNADIETRKMQMSMALEQKKHQDNMALEIAKLRNQHQIEMEKLRSSHAIEVHRASIKDPEEMDEENLSRIVERKRKAKEADGKKAESHKEVVDAIKGLTEAVEAPKKVKRDKNGKVTGVE